MNFYNQLKQLYLGECIYLTDLQRLNINKIPESYELSFESIQLKQRLKELGIETFLTRLNVTAFYKIDNEVKSQFSSADKELYELVKDIYNECSFLHKDKVHWDRLDWYLTSREIFKDVEIIDTIIEDPDKIIEGWGKFYNEGEGYYKVILHHKTKDEYIELKGTVDSYDAYPYFESFERCVTQVKPVYKDIVEYLPA